MIPTTGDTVRFKKSPIPISGVIKSTAIDHVEEDGTVWLLLTMRTKSEFVIKECEIEIVDEHKPVRRAG